MKVYIQINGVIELNEEQMTVHNKSTSEEIEKMNREYINGLRVKIADDFGIKNTDITLTYDGGV